MCIIACILLYLHSEVTQRFKRSYFIITSRMVKRKARKCHQNKLQGLLEVWVFLCTTFKIKTIHIFLRWTNLKNCLLVYWHESFYYDNNQGLLKSIHFSVKSWNINTKFLLILRISNYPYMWNYLKALLINTNKIKYYLKFFSGSKPRSACFSTANKVVIFLME